MSSPGGASEGPSLASSPAPSSTPMPATDPLQTPISSIVGPSSARYEGLLLEGDAGDRKVSKVNQVDQRVLDEELLDLLRLQLSQVTSMFSPGFMDRWKPELSLLMDWLLFRFTVLRNQPTPGMRMQGLRYADGGSAVGAPPRPSQRVLLALLCIGGRWGFARLRRCMTVWGWAAANSSQQEGEEDEGRRWRRRAVLALDWAETVFRVAWLLNLLVFLRHGRYPSLLERLTRMRLVETPPPPSQAGPRRRVISFSFMSRQLVWDHFSSLALVALPLVDWDALRRRVSSLIRQRQVMAGQSSLEAAAGVDDALSSCAICGSEEAQTPYVTECGHVFCYYCLKTACLHDQHFACPRCGAYFATSRRWAASR